MATVTSVYSVDPHVRTAEEITAALFRDERDDDSPRAKRPKPRNKNTTAHFPESASDESGSQVAISGIQVGRAWIIAQIALRRRSGQVLIALMDGQESLWKTMQWHLNFSAKTIPILDILHALAYVWEGCQFIREERLCSTCIYPKTIDENPAR